MVRYFFEDTDFTYNNRRLNNKWIKDAIISEGKVPGSISVIFCSDPYILDINRKYLSHDYYTDIITFDYCEDNIVSGDLFISIDSIRANSLFYNVSFEEELHRVIIHGILHLLSYDDHTEEDIAVMRMKENYYLGTRCKLISTL